MAKKKVERLKLTEALDRLDAMIDLIYRDVLIAIEVEAALEMANEIVTGELRDVHFYGADCYSSVQQSMRLFLSLTLAKLFETPRPGRGNDVASIPLMIRLLKQRRCRRRLCNRARSWTPNLTNSGELHARSVERSIDRAVEAYAKLRRTHAGRDAVAKLKKFRDKVLAHTLLVAALKATPLYRELFLLVDVARDVVQHARLAIAGADLDLLEHEEDHREMCRAFWRPALTAAATAGRRGHDPS
jgi:hypothetical protein